MAGIIVLAQRQASVHRVRQQRAELRVRFKCCRQFRGKSVIYQTVMDDQRGPAILFTTGLLTRLDRKEAQGQNVVN